MVTGDNVGVQYPLFNLHIHNGSVHKLDIDSEIINYFESKDSTQICTYEGDTTPIVNMRLAYL